MAATTTTIAVVGSNVLKSSGARLLSSFSSATNPHFPILYSSSSKLRRRTGGLSLIRSGHHTKGFPSFCTSPITTNTETITTTESSSSPPPPSPTDKDDNSDIKNAAHMLDIRVGRIIKAWRHEEADSLYVEEVDVGEPEPRIICSGLVKYIPMDILQDKKVVVLANLKPRNMRGVKSSGMLLAASDASHENVELLEPPEGSNPGERIWFGTQDDEENLPDPASPNQIQKKKIWESVQPHLKTNASCIAMLGEHLMQTSAGVVVSKSLKNANIA